MIFEILKLYNLHASSTPIAGQVDMYAVSYDDIERYSDSIAILDHNSALQISILSMKWEGFTASDEEVQEMLDKAFKK